MRPGVLKIAAVLAITAAVVTLLFFLFASKEEEKSLFFDDYDDDRPPVIINNSNSVEFEAHQGGPKQGQWTGGGKVWRHVVAGAQPTTILVMSNTTGNQKNCESTAGTTGLNPPFAAATMSVKFGEVDPATWETAKLSIVGGELQVEFADNPDLTGPTLRRHHGKTAVQIRQVILPGYICTYKTNGTVKVRIDQVK
jgi:hypothetical protein